jgi:ribonuclease III
MHPADALAERLGLPIRDRDLLEQALVHSSWLHEHPDAARGHNERLEFLGDAVVSIAVSEALYRRHPNDDEGVLSARRASIGSTPGLARLAARLELGDYLFLGEGEALRGGRVRPSLLASAFEALVGAIYLDLGWDVARDWIHAWAAEELAADVAPTTLKSPKSRLQEHTQRTSGDRPVYRLVEAVGPDHEKQFRIEVVVYGRVLGTGEGPSRRVAETSAAAEALEVLRRERSAARAARAIAAAEAREARQSIASLDAAETAIEAAMDSVGDDGDGEAGPEAEPGAAPHDEAALEPQHGLAPAPVEDRDPASPAGS